jgi:hypothetical protein
MGWEEDQQLDKTRRPDMREIGLVKGIAFLFELLYRRRHIDGIPHNDSVRHQIETTRLVS